MAMDPDLVKRTKEVMPKLNEQVSRGVAYYQMQEVEAYIDKIFRYAAKDFPPSLRYVGYKVCTPEEQFHEAVRGRENRRVYKMERNDFFLVRYYFHFVEDDGEVKELYRYLYLPIVDEGGTLYVRGRLFYISPILADPGYSKGFDYLFINFTRINLSFERLHWRYGAGGEWVNTYVAWSWIHKQGRDRSRNRTGPIFCSTMVNYILAVYGFSNAIELFCGAQAAVGTDADINANNYDPKEWVICHSSGIKPRSITKRSSYTPSNLCVAIPREQWSHALESFLGGFFYIVDHYPQTVTIEDLDEPILWKRLLGEAIFGEEMGMGILLEHVDEHLRQIELYMDPLVIEDLHYSGVDVNDINELFIFIVEELNRPSVDQSSSIASIYNKRLTTMRYVMSDVVQNINNLMYAVINQVKRRGNLDERRIRDAMNRNLKMSSVAKISDKERHQEVSYVSCATDNMIFGLTSSVIPQDSNTGSSKGKTNFNDKGKHLHVSLAEVGSFLNLPKSEPTGRSRINPFVQLGIDGSVIRREEFRDWLDSVQKNISK